MTPSSARQAVLGAGHTLTLRQGDLTSEKVDAIVNAANPWLLHVGGVAGAIVRKGGLRIQWESLRHGWIATGSATPTSAGRLPARCVIHAVGPVWRGNTPEKNDLLLTAAVRASLEIARTRSLKSIAFPAISSGIFGFPKDRCARVMIDALCGWADEHPEDEPRALRITLIDAETHALFEAEIARRLPHDEITP